jgi:hypothetical protein
MNHPCFQHRRWACLLPGIVGLAFLSGPACLLLEATAAERAKDSKTSPAAPRHTVHKWAGGTFVTFDSWRVQPVSANPAWLVYDTAPPGREPGFALRLLVTTPDARSLDNMFDLGPRLVQTYYPFLKRKGKQEKTKFGGDEARTERYEGQMLGRDLVGQVIYVRRKDVAVVVLGLGSEEGFKQYGRAVEVVAQSVSFKESPLDAKLVGSWTWQKASRTTFGRESDRVSATSTHQVVIYGNGAFTETSSGTVDASAKTRTTTGWAGWLKEGSKRGRVVRRGNVLTFRRDDGTTWTVNYELKGDSGLMLGRDLYIKE